MMTNAPHSCNEIRLAALARLDGEETEIPLDRVEAHVAHCVSCRAAIAGLRALHADLARVDFERLDADLWVGLQPRIAEAAHPRGRRELAAVLGLSVVLVAWRLAQLLLDLPAPVVNSIVPLALVVAVLRWLTGDPFAIQTVSHQLQQRRAS
jgi:hypothetical protein